MSTKQNEQLKKAQDPREPRSVLDFLYYDAQRVGGFLSQFNNYGHLTQLTKGREAAERAKTSDLIDGSVSVPGIAKARGTYGTENESLDKMNNQETYDPTWVNLLTFLDVLQERNMIKRDIDKAGIGQFVLASGELAISDLQLVEKTWKLKAVEKAMRSGTKSRAGNDELSMMLDLISILPHTVQVELTGEHSVWSSITHKWLSVASSDLFLGHGKKVAGKWNVLGVLDARPDPLSSLSSVTPDFTDGMQFASKMLDLLAPICRNVLGRPPMSFGVTPLAIFREVAA